METEEDPLNPPELWKKPKKQPPSLILLVFKWLVIILLLTSILIGYIIKSRRTPGQLTACRSHMKEVAIALELYASENGGHYPKSLEELVRVKYVQQLPTCPAAQKMTYTDYRVATRPDSFSFSCVGDHHRQVYGKPAPAL